MTLEVTLGEPARATTVPPDLRTHLTDPSTRAALMIRQSVLTAVRRLLDAEGFVEIQAPIIGPVTDPGVRGAKQMDVDFYGHRYKLMTSAILYKQATLLAFDKIYYIAPNVRMEPLETFGTDRHLVEFHQIDVEMAGASRNDATALCERLVVAATREVLQHRPAQLGVTGRDLDALRRLGQEPFGRMTHAAAVAELAGMSQQADAHAEIDWSNEEMLSLEAPRPFFLTDYPKGSRGFYDRESRSDPGTLRNFDLIAAEGFGELCSGGERESDYRRIMSRIRETGENPAKYGWYLELAREGLHPSAGFGLGLERLVRYIAGLDAVWQASAYPKLAGVRSA
ncbi:asparagine synthetase A [Kineosporia mesophila]|uniref:Asparagine synthetase A n=1 Tax=Kineosporia mesophila TaxID=566012 RepID=A0ABP6ZBV1_9ACTN